MELLKRPRRLRGSELVRRMVRETRMDAASLIYPMFVMDGVNRVDEISSLPGQYRYTVDRMEEELIRLVEAGVHNVMFFGIPAHKDEVGSQAICISSQISACANTLLTGIAGSCAVTTWTTTERWSIWPKQPSPMWRRVRRWWRPPI